ncbi:MAG TPA: hypothetical protein P5075_11185 [Eubacteriales bacterium]|nr:hypothetical protein [Eubacteriales bacterium]
MKRQEMQQLLEERIQRITLLETRIDTMEQLIDGYRRREQAIIDTLRSSQESAEKTKADALRRAEEAVSQAEQRAEQALASAEAEAAAIRAAAQEKADALLTAAKEESARLQAEAAVAMRAHEEALASYNALLQRSAGQAQESAAQFAAFMAGQRIEPPAAMQDLPDPEGDPAQLMRNIYRLQNRPIPEAAETDAPVEPGHQSQAEAWQEAAQPSAETEAETPAPEPKAEVQRAFESMFTGGDDAAKASPEPYSGEAWASEEHKSDGEPQAEFAQSFDAAFESSDFALTPDAECAKPEAGAQEIAETEERTVEEETGLAFDELFPPEEAGTEAEENAKLAAAFEAAAADEAPEWEPEGGAEASNAAEPEAPEDGTNGDDVSLDDLLDEIINAGE